MSDCRTTATACFVKQLGANPSDGVTGCKVCERHNKGGDTRMPEHIYARLDVDQVSALLRQAGYTRRTQRIPPKAKGFDPP